MNACDVIEQIRNAHPARQHGDVGDERDVAHELLARAPRVASEHFQFALVWSQTKDRIERRRFAGAVWTDEPEDAALFDSQVNAIERHGSAERFAKTACFYASHNS